MQLLTVDDVANSLNISKRTVWSLIAAGKIRTIRLARRIVRIHPDDLNLYIEQQRNQQGRR